MTPATPTWISAFLDLAPEEPERATAFWQGVTGYGLSPARGDHDEFATLLPPDGDDFLRVQRLGGGPSRIHLDLHVADLAPARSGRPGPAEDRPDPVEHPRFNHPHMSRS